jgi:hypothetical protein
MKRCIALFLALVLAASLLPIAAMGETWYVYTANGKTLNLRDEYTNKVIGHIPYGTALTPDMDKSTEIAAYVTYKGVSGFAKWEFLQKTPPKPKKSSKNTASATPAPAQQTAAAANQGNVPYQGSTVVNQGSFEISAVGAYIQYADSKNKGAGDKWAAVSVSPQDNIVLTADVPKGRKIDYWVINGVRYDFNETVKTLRLTKADRDFNIEVVYTKALSQTLLSPETIQANRTGELLEIKTKHAQLCHIKNISTGAGGWITSFDFTNDYTNRASGEWELGGQVTARVKATVGKNQKVRGWKFDETELYPNSQVTHFIVRTLNTSMTYEPIFGTVKAKVTTPPETPTERVQYYTVTCRNCVFSGGGYSNATSGTVPAGTKITVVNKSGSSEVSGWEVNGSKVVRFINRKTGQRVYSTAQTITRTINKNTSIVCYGVIN